METKSATNVDLPQSLTETFDAVHLQWLLDLEKQPETSCFKVLRDLVPICGEEEVEHVIKILDKKRLDWTGHKFNMAKQSWPKKFETLSEELVDPCLLVRSYTMDALYSKVSALLNDKTKRGNKELAKKGYRWCNEIKRSVVKISEKANAWVRNGTVYRGMKYTYKNVEEHLPENSLVIWYTIKSTTTEKSVIRRPTFCGDVGPRTIFEIIGCEGVDISQLSEYEDEAEIILHPGSYFRVEKTKKGSQEFGDPFEKADYVQLRYLGNDINGCLQLASKLTPKVMMIGNPGKGKSALLNAYSKRPLFKSQYSIKGVTERLEKGWDGDPGSRMFLDTPGPDDDTSQKAAALAIFTALVEGGCFQVFMVVTLDGGRLTVAEEAPIKAVCEACGELDDFKFSVIVNKVHQQSMGHSEGITAELKRHLGDRCQEVHFVPHVPSLEGANNQVWEMPDKLRAKLDSAPSMRVEKSKIKQVRFQNFCDLVEKHRREIEELEATKKQDRQRLYWALAFSIVIVMVAIWKCMSMVETIENLDVTVKHMNGQMNLLRDQLKAVTGKYQAWFWYIVAFLGTCCCIIVTTSISWLF